MVNFYLWFMIALFVLSALGRVVLFYKTDAVSIIDLIESLIALISCVGLYGYLQTKYFLSSSFWFSIIFVGVSLGLFNLFFSEKTFKLIEKVGLRNAILILAASYIITAPCIYFLYLYAKSENFRG